MISRLLQCSTGQNLRLKGKKQIKSLLPRHCNRFSTKKSEDNLEGFDDDDDFLETLEKVEKQNQTPKRKSSWSHAIVHDDIDAIFGSPSPLSRLKNLKSNKENDIHQEIRKLPKLNFDEENKAGPSVETSAHQSCDSADEDDIPLVYQDRWKEDHEPIAISDDDEDVINLAEDLDDYEAPLENLQTDCLTQQFLQDADWEELEEDEADADNFDIGEGGDALEEESDSRESQEMFGPSPLKQPTIRPPRLSIGEQVIFASEVGQEKTDVKSVPELQEFVDHAIETRKKLFRNKNFHKDLSKLIPTEAMDLRKDYATLTSQILEIFPLLPFDYNFCLPESVCKSLRLVQECQLKLRKRLIDYEESHPNALSPRENDSECDASPPFDGLPDVDTPPCQAPLSAPAMSSTAGQTRPKFTFKKPGTSSATLPTTPATTNFQTALTTSTWDTSPATIPGPVRDTPSQVWNPPVLTSSFSSGYERSSREALGTSTSTAESHNRSSSGGASHTGTQLIEDFHTQSIQEPDTVNYTSKLYKEKCDDINIEGKFLGEARNDGKDPRLCSENHEFSSQVREVLSKTFGLRTFRPNQLAAINGVLLGHDTFVLMPTGGGKSLCYQLPASVKGGVTVVVSPLVSLIQDQVTKLNGLGITADHMSGEDYGRQQTIYSKMRSSQPGPTLLYVTPEKLSNSNKLTDALRSLYNRDK